MSRLSSDLPLEITSGLQRLVSIVDEQRPSGTPAALQVLNFDFSSKSGIDLLRGALGVGGDSRRWLEYAGIDILTLALLISIAWPAFVDDYNEHCRTELSLGRFLAALCCSFKIVSSQLADSPTIQNNVDLSEMNFSAVFENRAEVAHYQEEEYWKIDPPTDASDDVEAAFDTTNIVLAIVAREGVKYEEWEGRAIGYYNAAKQQIGSE